MMAQFPNVRPGQWIVFSNNKNRIHKDLEKPLKLLNINNKLAHLMNIEQQTLVFGIYGRHKKMKLDRYDLPPGTTARVVSPKTMCNSHHMLDLEIAALNKVRTFALTMRKEGFGQSYYPLTGKPANRDQVL